MKYDPQQHHRRSIRLQGWDYATPGAYSVTICTDGKVHLFGNIIEGKMIQSDTGRMVESMWLALPEHYPGVRLDAFVVMPNHVHGILLLSAEGRAWGPAPTLGDVVGRFKSLTTRLYARGKLWQRSYYEHIIRNDEDLNHTRRYIAENVLRWPTDPENV